MEEDDSNTTAHQMNPVNTDVDTANILTGSRKRKAKEDRPPITPTTTFELFQRSQKLYASGLQ
jgi:hypothetical protein